MASFGAASTERPARSTRKGAETRQRLLDAAAALLGSRGPEGIAMAEVAERAGVSKGSAYYYFADCDQIVHEVVVNELDAMVAAFERAAATATSARDALLRIGGSFVDMLRRDRPIVRYVLGGLQMSAAPSEAATERERLSRRLVNLVSVQLERGKVEGSVRRDVDVRFAATAILGAFLGAAATGALLPPGSEGGFAQLEASLLDFISHGVSETPAG